MSPTALRIHNDFVRLAAEEPCSLYCEEFLLGGVSVVPDFALRFPELRMWNGLRDLKRQLAESLFRNPNSTRVLLASRTTALMRLSAELLARRCRRVLATDLVWPPYLRLLRTICGSRCDVQLIPIRKQLFNKRLGQSGFVRRVLDEFGARHCDGLFLPLVDHCGVRLPVGPIVRELRRCGLLSLAVADASQAYGHIECQDPGANFVFGGSHKWLRSYLPLAIGWAADEQTASDLKSLGDEPGGDPLLRTVESWLGGTSLNPRQTINVTPLLSCRGALLDAATHLEKTQQANRELVEALLRESAWECLGPQSMTTGIILARTRVRHLRRVAPGRLREAFNRAGVSVTTYAGGFLRLSVPFEPFTTTELDRLVEALRVVSGMSRINRMASPPTGEFSAPT